VATLHGGALKLNDASPGLRATLALPAAAGAVAQNSASALPLNHQQSF
jgi:hypothetical protein